MERKNILNYAAMSANLYNFMGDVDFYNHINVFKEAVDNAKSAHEHIKNFNVDDIVIEDPSGLLDKMSTDPPLMISFHTGSYNMLASYLLKSGYHFNFLADTASILDKTYQQSSERHATHYGVDCKVNMINVEEGGTIFKIVRELKANVPTIGFIDGNKGVGGQVMENENLITVPFLKGKVRVRKGLAYMAYISNKPITLVLSYKKGGKDFLKFSPPLEISAADKEDFCLKVNTTLFKLFGEHVSEYPGQWSNWMFLQNWADTGYFQEQHQTNIIDRQPVKGSLTFNRQRFAPLKMDRENYLFDRLKYTMMPIPEQYLSIFSNKVSENDRKNAIAKYLVETPELINQYVNKHVLI